MQYMLLIYEPESVYEGEVGERRLQDVILKHRALAAELTASGVQKGGSGLERTHAATTVVTEGGRQTVHDGPFAETREHLGGYYLIEVPDLDQAIAIAKRVPVGPGGKVEVRPQLQMPQV